MNISRNLPWGIFVPTFASLLLFLVSSAAGAHEIPASKILLDIGAYNVQVELQLPLAELREAVGLSNTTTATDLVTQYSAQTEVYIDKHIGITTIDGKHYVQRVALLEASRIRDGDCVVAHIDFTVPRDASSKTFILDYDIIIADIVTHNALVSVHRDFRNALFGDESGDNTPLIGLMHYQQTHLKIDGSGGSWFQGFQKVFHLGMQHIADGFDHILFLLVLLLSAPLHAHNGRWHDAVTIKTSICKVIKIVSGFTLGHSLTLMLGAAGTLAFPARIIEVAIALSILISALHVIRPLFADREHYIAALFGLVHGMAFAASLTGFDYDACTLISAVFGFNLGIEAMQLLIVAATLPSLLLMRASPLYRYLRIIVAITAGLLAVAWALERAFDFTNPFDVASAVLTQHLLSMLTIFAALAVISRIKDFVSCIRRFATPRRSRINSAHQIQ